MKTAMRIIKSPDNTELLVIQNPTIVPTEFSLIRIRGRLGDYLVVESGVMHEYLPLSNSDPMEYEDRITVVVREREYEQVIQDPVEEVPVESKP